MAIFVRIVVILHLGRSVDDALVISLDAIFVLSFSAFSRCPSSASSPSSPSYLALNFYLCKSPVVSSELCSAKLNFSLEHTEKIWTNGRAKTNIGWWCVALRLLLKLTEISGVNDVWYMLNRNPYSPERRGRCAHWIARERATFEANPFYKAAPHQPSTKFNSFNWFWNFEGFFLFPFRFSFPLFYRFRRTNFVLALHLHILHILHIIAAQMLNVLAIIKYTHVHDLSP